MFLLGCMVGSAGMVLLGLAIAGIAGYGMSLLRPTYFIRMTTVAGQNVCVASSHEDEEIARVRIALDHAIALVH